MPAPAAMPVMSLDHLPKQGHKKKSLDVVARRWNGNLCLEPEEGTPRDKFHMTQHGRFTTDDTVRAGAMYASWSVNTTADLNGSRILTGHGEARATDWNTAQGQFCCVSTPSRDKGLKSKLKESFLASETPNGQQLCLILFYYTSYLTFWIPQLHFLIDIMIKLTRA